MLHQRFCTRIAREAMLNMYRHQADLLGQVRLRLLARINVHSGLHLNHRPAEARQRGKEEYAADDGDGD